MRSIYSILVTLVLFFHFAAVQSGNSRAARVLSSPRLPSVNNGIREQTTSTIDQRISDIDQRIGSFASQLLVIDETLKSVLAKVPTVSDLQQQNDELRRMLDKFESFFGTLYAETPEAFLPEAAIQSRMSRLNEYLGNREAELAGLRPSPITVVDGHETFDPDLLGKVLAQITEDNSKLAEKVQALQSKVDIRAPRKDGVRVRRNAVDSPRQNVTGDGDMLDVTEEGETAVDSKLVETIVNALSSLNDSSRWNSNGTADTDIIDESLTIEEEIDILTAGLFGDAESSRKRKSAFSAASASSLLGKSYPQVVTFDHVYVNKGYDFKEENSTFVCQISGYYFITFNCRSFDNRHLGVSLMKNNEVMTAIYSDGSERNVMQSQNLILHLGRYDRLYLQLGPSENYAIYSDSRKYTTFSTFLLYRGD